MAVDLSVFSRLKTKEDFDREAEEFQLRKQALIAQKTGQAPAAVKLANEIQAARQTGDLQRLNDLQMSAKLLDRGVVYDQMGNPIAMGGYGDAVGTIEGAKALYKQNSQNQSDLYYKPTIARDVAQQQADVEFATQPMIEAANKAAVMKSEASTQAQINNPKLQAQSKQMLDLLEGIEKDPGLEAVVGLPNPLKGRIPFIGNVAGSPAADFQAKLDQLGGKQFLEAFESLKGGGQITQIEGEKATNAIARMQTAQSETAFRAALAEFKAIVQGAATRAETAAQGAVSDDQFYGQNIQPLTIDDLGEINDPMAASRNAIMERNAQGIQNPNQTLPQPQGQPAAPKKGQVVNGYLFMGGSPADKSNWKKVK